VSPVTSSNLAEYLASIARNLTKIRLGWLITPLSILAFLAAFFIKYRPKHRQI
jgi:hypothetical protein